MSRSDRILVAAAGGALILVMAAATVLLLPVEGESGPDDVAGLLPSVVPSVPAASSVPTTGSIVVDVEGG